MGWLPSAPQLGRNPLSLKAEADKAGLSPAEFTVQALKSGELRMACEQPDNGSNHPRNLFVWRSNLLGSSGKGHEYMQSICWVRKVAFRGKNLDRRRESNQKKSSGKLRRLKASSTCW